MSRLAAAPPHAPPGRTPPPPTSTGWTFELPEERAASRPPEARGLARDEVRLLVARPARVTHTRFRHLADHLAPGDLLVVNTSATLPAAVDAVRVDGGGGVVVHVAGPHPAGDGSRVVELRRPDGRGPVADARPGETLALDGGVGLVLLDAHPAPAAGGQRLWRARSRPDVDLEAHLAVHGRPITYGYLAGRWPLATYQPVYSRVPGSAEMASAGRPFTADLVTELVARGVHVAPVQLHAGVSSAEAHEPPAPERVEVPAPTARLVDHTRRHGGRVVAVGTTVTRALESAARPDGTLAATSGWTDLVLGDDRPARVVDGLVTGWHPPGASHLALLQAVAGAELVERAYAAALERDYLWHEFGDSCLLLP